MTLMSGKSSYGNMNRANGQKSFNKRAPKRDYSGKPKPLPTHSKNVCADGTESEIVSAVVHALRNPGSTFAMLQRFSDALDKDENGKELVTELLRQTTGGELVSLLKDATKLKAPDIALIFTVLEKVILMIASELMIFESTALEIAELLIAKHSRTFHYMLKITNKSNQIKSALKLIIAIATLGPKTTRLVVTKFDLAASGLISLMTRRNTADPQDVRACVLHLLVALLMFGDSNVIRQLMMVKNLLSSTLSGLVVDRAEVILLFISTLQDRILKNLAVPKTQKVQLFNQTSLKNLLRTLHWNGHKKSEKEFKEDEPAVIGNAGQKEREDVQSAILEIVKLICTSVKYGIVFQDPLIGTGPKNQNHILTDLLKTLSFASASHRHLATEILSAAPDQIVHFLPTWKALLVPRPSDKWNVAIDLLSTVYSTFDVGSKVPKMPLKNRVKPLSVLILSPVVDKELLLEALKDPTKPDIASRMFTFAYQRLLSSWNAVNLLNEAEKQELKTLLSEQLADPNSMMDFIRKVDRKSLTDVELELMELSRYMAAYATVLERPLIESAAFIHDDFELYESAVTFVSSELSRKQSAPAASAYIEKEMLPSSGKADSRKLVAEQKQRNEKIRLVTSLCLLRLLDNSTTSLPFELKVAVMENYHATLSPVDKNLLLIIRKWDGLHTQGISLSVFGNVAKRQAEFKSTKGRGFSQPTIREFVDSLDPSLIKKTIRFFPIKLPLYSRSDYTDVDVYDPRFLFANFCGLLGASSFTATHFVESGCLSIVFSALGSLDGAMRAAAGHFLQMFAIEVEKLHFKGKEHLLYVLQQIQRSTDPEKPWPALWTAALCRFVEVMFSGENHVYQLLMEFFLVKPEFRLDSVPEFLKLFQSGNVSHVKERRFILELLRDGIRHYRDYEVCQRNHVFEQIMALCGSVLSNKNVNLLISEVMLNASRVPFIGRQLVRTHSLFPWMDYQLGCLDDPEALGNLIGCVENSVKDLLLSKKEITVIHGLNQIIPRLVRTALELDSSSVTKSAVVLTASYIAYRQSDEGLLPFPGENVQDFATLLLRHHRNSYAEGNAESWRARSERLVRIVKLLSNRLAGDSIALLGNELFAFVMPDRENEMNLD